MPTSLAPSACKKLTGVYPSKSYLGIRAVVANADILLLREFNRFIEKF